MLPSLDMLLKPRPRKFRNIVKHLSPLIFQAPEINDLTEEDVFDDLSGNRGTDHFLGIYSRKGIELVFEKVGFFQELDRRGLLQGTVRIDTSDPYKHLLRIIHPEKDPPLISCELVVRQGNFDDFPTSVLKDQKISSSNMLVVEWLLLQNPLKPFTRRRPQLPGQDHPGLGLSSLVFELLYWTARRSDLDGIILVPNYLHTGYFYGRHLHFFGPQHQGILAAVERCLKAGTRLDQLSWACAEGQLVNRNTREVFRWKPALMVMPVTPSWKHYFESETYRQQVKSSEKNYTLDINSGYEKKYNRHWEAI